MNTNMMIKDNILINFTTNYKFNKLLIQIILQIIIKLHMHNCTNFLQHC